MKLLRWANLMLGNERMEQREAGHDVDGAEVSKVVPYSLYRALEKRIGTDVTHSVNKYST